MACEGTVVFASTVDSVSCGNISGSAKITLPANLTITSSGLITNEFVIPRGCELVTETTESATTYCAKYLPKTYVVDSAVTWTSLPVDFFSSGYSDRKDTLSCLKGTGTIKATFTKMTYTVLDASEFYGVVENESVVILPDSSPPKCGTRIV